MNIECLFKIYQRQASAAWYIRLYPSPPIWYQSVDIFARTFSTHCRFHNLNSETFSCSQPTSAPAHHCKSAVGTRHVGCINLSIEVFPQSCSGLIFGATSQQIGQSRKSGLLGQLQPIRFDTNCSRCYRRMSLSFS